MINREIVYERNVTGSFMKIPAGSEGGIDERLMLRRKLPGVLPVEKAYVDGGGQYWYNISGKQSLDTYCRVKEVQMDFVEQLIISICGLMERLEWNLIHTNCLMLDPELVFVSNASREFMFLLYPGGTQTVEQEFQILMEYLMKKVDHKDAQAVRAVYRIYEQTLEDGYQITDIRSMLLRDKGVGEKDEVWEPPVHEKKKTERATDVGAFIPKNNENRRNDNGKYSSYTSDGTGDRRKKKNRKKTIDRMPQKRGNSETKEESIIDVIKDKLIAWGILQETAPSKAIVYPDEIAEPDPEPVPVIHPTVCLTNLDGQPKGELRYTGSEGLSDIQLTEQIMRIGYGAEADIRIDRMTISQFHARIHKEDDGFYIEDLNSTNGTFVNEELLVYREQRKLACNDIVQFADIRYRFC